MQRFKCAQLRLSSASMEEPRMERQSLNRSCPTRKRNLGFYFKLSTSFSHNQNIPQHSCLGVHGTPLTSTGIKDSSPLPRLKPQNRLVIFWVRASPSWGGDVIQDHGRGVPSSSWGTFAQLQVWSKISIEEETNIYLDTLIVPNPRIFTLCLRGRSQCSINEIMDSHPDLLAFCVNSTFCLPPYSFTSGTQN